MDGSIPPSPQRLARAHAFGTRPRARWLEASAATLATMVAIEFAPAAGVDAAAWSRSFERALVHSDASAALELGAHAITLFAGALVAAALAATAVTRQLGARSRIVDIELGPRATEPSPAWMAVLAVVGWLVLATVLISVHAGAARAADASAAGLAGVWGGWVVRVLASVAWVCAGLGLLEQRAAQHRLWRALHRTPAEVRRDAARRPR